MTDYGDTAVWMLEFLQKQHWQPKFDAEAFAAFLWDKVNRYSGYINMATKEVIANYMNGKRGLAASSQHGDLAGATRCVALLFVFEEEEALGQAARRCAEVTHNHPHTITAAEFILRMAFRILQDHRPGGQDSIRKAMVKVRATMKNKIIDYVIQIVVNKDDEVSRQDSALNKQFKKLGASTVLQNDIAVRTLGGEVKEVNGNFPLREGVHMGMMAKASPALGALAASLYLMLRHPELGEATVQNMLMGGDNSARAIPIGIILGAAQGLPPSLQELQQQLRAYTSGELEARLNEWGSGRRKPE